MKQAWEGALAGSPSASRLSSAWVVLPSHPLPHPHLTPGSSPSAPRSGGSPIWSRQSSGNFLSPVWELEADFIGQFPPQQLMGLVSHRQMEGFQEEKVQRKGLDRDLIFLIFFIVVRYA